MCLLSFLRSCRSQYNSPLRLFITKNRKETEDSKKKVQDISYLCLDSASATTEHKFSCNGCLTSLLSQKGMFLEHNTSATTRNKSFTCKGRQCSLDFLFAHKPTKMNSTILVETCHLNQSIHFQKHFPRP